MDPLLYQIWDVGRQLASIEKDFDKLMESVEKEELTKEDLLREIQRIKAKCFPNKE